MRQILALSLVVLVAGAGRADDKEKSNAEKVVGTWKLVATTQKDFPEDVTVTVEFTKDGKMNVRFEPKDKTQEAATLKGKYKLDKDKIDYTLDTGDGETKQEVLTIKKLTADELVVVDPDGIKEEFKRVTEKKKD